MKKSMIVLSSLVVLGAMIFVYNNNGQNNGKTTSHELNVDNAVRKLASADEVDLIENKINPKIWNLNSKVKVQKYLAVLHKLAEDNPDYHILQTYDAILYPLIRLEGILWRLRKIVSKCQVCHLQMVGALKKAYYLEYMAGPHLTAMMDYLSEPTEKYPQYENIAEVQDSIADHIIPDLEYSLKQLKKVAASIPEGEFFRLDGYLISGFDEKNNIRFLSNKPHKRSKIVTQGNIHLLISYVEDALGALNFAIAYNVDDAFKLANKLVRKTALNNLLRKTPKVITPKEYLETIDKFEKFGSARFELKSGQAILDRSMNFFTNAVNSRLEGLKLSKDQADLNKNNEYLLTPKLLDLDYDDAIALLEERKKIFEDGKKNIASKLTSEVSGIQVSLNPKAIFTYRENLQAFLPKKDFLSTDRVKTIAGEDAWDYRYGKPIAWKDATFGNLLPDATDANLYETIRILKTIDSARVFTQIIPVP